MNEAHAGNRYVNWLRALLVGFLCLMTQTGWAQPAQQQVFATPAEGVEALVGAVRSHNVARMNEILGPEGERLVNSGDDVADRKNRDDFVKAYRERHQLVPEGDDQLTLTIGENEWPLPIPLVKSDKGWYFDTRKGDDEILARRIGRNEAMAVKVLLEIVDSEREYAALNRSEDGMPVYATRIISSADKRDGLYWPTREGEPLSPIGELVAAAAAEGYTSPDAMQASPYNGYLYRILTRQGNDARGGEQEYVVAGKMTAGFAAIAWPARYGASGVMTFMVNHEGQVYEKNLGPNTAEIAAGIAGFNPDESWKPAEPRDN